MRFESRDGENPTRIEHLWQKLFRAQRNLRSGPLMVHTISAIDATSGSGFLRSCGSTHRFEALPR